MSLPAHAPRRVLRPRRDAAEPTLEARTGVAPLAETGRLAARTVWAVLGLAVAWLAVVLALRWPALTFPAFVSNSPIDSAFFAYAGDIVRRGGTPYLSFWDHKPPLIYFLDAAALTLSGGALWGVWALCFATLVGTLFLGYAAARRIYGPAPALLAAVFIAVAVQGILAVGLTEGFAPPLQWLAILAFAWWWSGGPALGAGAALGVTTVLLALLRPNLVGAPVVAGLVVMAHLLRIRDRRGWVALTVGALAGAASAVAPMLFYLWSRGALPAFRDQVLIYNALYVGAASWGDRARAVYAGLHGVGGALLVLGLAGWALTVARLVREPESRRHPALRLVALWFPVELTLAALAGRDYGHYFMPLYTPLALAVAGLGAELRALGRGARERRSAPVLGALGLALAGPAVADLAYWVHETGVPHDRADQLRATGRYLEARTAESTPILVWGHAADVYFFSHRRPATRFVYPLALLTPGYATPARVDSFVAEVRATAPAVIVDATRTQGEWDAIVPALGRWDPGWQYPVRSPRPYWRTTQALRRFYDYVAATYVAADTIGPERWVVYRRRAPAERNR
jgi:hypothetical protein